MDTDIATDHAGLFPRHGGLDPKYMHLLLSCFTWCQFQQSPQLSVIRVLYS